MRPELSGQLDYYTWANFLTKNKPDQTSGVIILSIHYSGLYLLPSGFGKAADFCYKKNRMKRLLSTILIIFVPVLYLTHRAKTIEQIDTYSDSFFADYSQSKETQIKKYLHKKQNLNGALSVIAKHKQAIVNFDYKNTKPTVNFVLNKAIIDVSWHLTIVFEKHKNSWGIIQFKEYTNNQ